MQQQQTLAGKVAVVISRLREPLVVRLELLRVIQVPLLQRRLVFRGLMFLTMIRDLMVRLTVFIFRVMSATHTPRSFKKSTGGLMLAQLPALVLLMLLKNCPVIRLIWFIMVEILIMVSLAGVWWSHRIVRVAVLQVLPAQQKGWT